jgi:hypothetical protein
MPHLSKEDKELSKKASGLSDSSPYVTRLSRSIPKDAGSDWRSEHQLHINSTWKKPPTQIRPPSNDRNEMPRTVTQVKKPYILIHTSRLTGPIPPI